MCIYIHTYIQDGTFHENNLRLKAVNCFGRKIHLRRLTRLSIRLCTPSKS